MSEPLIMILLGALIAASVATIWICQVKLRRIRRFIMDLEVFKSQCDAAFDRLVAAYAGHAPDAEIRQHEKAFALTQKVFEAHIKRNRPTKGTK